MHEQLSGNAVSSNLQLTDSIVGDCFAGRSGHPVLPRHLYLLAHRARNDGNYF